MIPGELKELLLQALVHERGGVLIYKTALECAVNEDLSEEWTKYLAQTEKHVSVLTDVCETLGVDPGEMTPGCQIVQHNGKSLVVAMKMALAEADPDAAQLVACDSVLLAETKDHANWELIGECAKGMDPPIAAALTGAYEEIEEEEDEHLYHTQGWCRELWLQSLGLKAVLPPPEEKRDVKSASEAQEAKKSRRVKG
jgi:hypothetical protein